MARRAPGIFVAMLLRFLVLMFAIVVLMKMYVGVEGPAASSPSAPETADQQVPTHRISFPSAFRVGGLALPAGEYSVRHLEEADRHLMTFTAIPDAAVYHVPCRLEMLTETARLTQQQYRLDASGQKRLAALIFEGERVRHVF